MRLPSAYSILAAPHRQFIAVHGGGAAGGPFAMCEQRTVGLGPNFAGPEAQLQPSSRRRAITLKPARLSDWCDSLTTRASKRIVKPALRSSGGIAGCEPSTGNWLK